MTQPPNTEDGRFAAVVDGVHEYLVWLILASYLMAGFMPAFGLWLRDVNLATIGAPWHRLEFTLPHVMLGALLFNAGLGVKLEEISRLFTDPRMLCSGVVGNMVTPLLFILVLSVLMDAWHNPEEVQHILVGLALVIAMPIAGASTAWAQNANGNLGLSLGLVLITTLLSPLITPAVLHIVGYVTTGDYSKDLHELASGGVLTFLGAWVVLPSVIGILLRSIAGGERVETVKPYLKLSNFIILVLLNYSNAALSLPQALRHPDLDFLGMLLLIVVALCLLAFVTGYAVARMTQATRDERVSLVFGLGMNNNGTGLVLASASLADHPQVMLPVIFYTLVQHVVAALADVVLSRESPDRLSG